MKLHKYKCGIGLVSTKTVKWGELWRLVQCFIKVLNAGHMWKVGEPAVSFSKAPKFAYNGEI